MIRNCLLAILTFLPLSSLIAQNIEWEKNLGGSYDDNFRSLQKASDGGYFVGGTDDAAFVKSFSMYKLDSNGNIEWDASYGGGEDDRNEEVLQTSGGQFLAVGRCRSDLPGSNADSCDFPPCSDLCIVKFDDSGNQVWDTLYGGTLLDYGNSIDETSDGGFIVAGSSTSSDGDISGTNKGELDYWILKLDDTGQIEWEKNYGGSGEDIANSIKQTSDGGYIVAGSSSSTDEDVSGNNGLEDYWVLKLDASGNIEWDQNFGGSQRDEAFSIAKTQSGGYVVVGESNNTSSGSFDYYVVKMDGNGNPEWEKNFGGGGYDYGYSIAETKWGKYIVSGTSNSTDGDVTGNIGGFDYWVFKLDKNGNMIWEENFGGTDTDDETYSIQPTNGGYIVGGTTYSSDVDVSGNNGGYDYWIAKIEDPNSSVEEKENESFFQLGPNPTSGQLQIDLGRTHRRIQLTIRDLTGRTVHKQEIENVESFRTRIEEKPGLYFVELRSEDGRKEVRKVMKKL